MTEIGEIPEEWNIKKISELEQNMYYGITAKATEQNTNLRMLRTTDIKNFKFNLDNLPFCEITEKRSDLSKYFLKRNDIIIARAGTVGVSILVQENLNNTLFGSYLIKIVFKQETIDMKFIHYYFQSQLYWSNISNAQGSTIKNINLPFLNSLEIPLPPLPEQQKIAEILSTADDEIQKVDEQITLTEHLKKGLMQKLLTRGIGHTRFKMTEIGGIPEEWDVRELKEFAKVEYGKSNPRTDGKIPLVGSSGVFGRVAKALIESPTIVIGRKGTAGAVWDIESPSWPSDTSFYLIYKNYGIVQKYLYSFMSLNKLSGDKAKTTLPSLQKTELEKFIVPLPPFPEQQKIAEILSTVDNKLELLRRKKEKLDVLKKGLMNDLLTGKVRVKV
jgi:type I restriction enzyme S subunit